MMQDCCYMLNSYCNSGLSNTTDQTWNSITTVVIPLTIINLFGTAFIVLLSKCVQNVFHNKEDADTDIEDENEDPEEKEVDLDESESYNEPPQGVLEPIDSSLAKNENEDEDLIAQVRKETGSKMQYSRIPGGVPDELSTGFLIAGRSPQSSSENARMARDELSGEQASLESVAGTLISVTKNIAGTLDNATHIPKEKKQELASLLRGIPGFITKIVDMDDDELNALLKGKSPLATKEPVKVNESNDGNNKTALLSKESDYLMMTLDSLRDA